MGEGPPVYATVRTRDPGDADGDLDPGEEEGDEEEGGEGVGVRAQGPQLIPPVGVKADVLSGNTAVVYWTDTTLTKSQVTVTFTILHLVVVLDPKNRQYKHRPNI